MHKAIFLLWSYFPWSEYFLACLTQDILVQELKRGWNRYPRNFTEIQIFQSRSGGYVSVKPCFLQDIETAFHRSTRVSKCLPRGIHLFRRAFCRPCSLQCHEAVTRCLFTPRQSQAFLTWFLVYLCSRYIKNSEISRFPKIMHVTVISKM